VEDAHHDRRESKAEPVDLGQSEDVAVMERFVADIAGLCGAVNEAKMSNAGTCLLKFLWPIVNGMPIENQI